MKAKRNRRKLKAVAGPLFVWCAQYCSCTYEGSMVDIALCRTRAKARKVLSEHKREIMRPEIEAGVKYPRKSWEVWRVIKREVL